MLFFWVWSNPTLGHYSDIGRALENLDAHPDIIKIIKKSLSIKPEERQQSAVILATEIERITAQRSHIWANQDRARCRLVYTRRALDLLHDEMENKKESDITKFVSQDINNDSCIQRFIEKTGTVDERIVPNHYFVLGNVFRYHIAEDNRGRGFAILNVIRPENHFILLDRQNSAESPLTFEFDAGTGIVNPSNAIILIEKVLEEFEVNLKEEERRGRETILFDTWIRVLEAKIQYEREQSNPIHFNWSTANGPFVTLRTEDETERVVLGEGRTIECGDRRWIRGEVWEVRPGEIVLNCARSSLSNLPQIGIARLDLWAMKVAIDRQLEAVDKIRSGNTANSILKELIINPQIANTPTEDIVISEDIEKVLDQSKILAVKKALGSNDVLTIEGPPGTGKTQFIAALVNEELARNPKAHILIASQTHVAIDNALDRIARFNSNLNILRIASAQSSDVSSSSEPYLMDQQLKTWQNEISVKSEKGLERWAKNHNLDLTDIKIRTFVRQMANIQQRIEINREKINQEENRKLGLEIPSGDSPNMENTLEIDRISADLDDFRTQLDIDKRDLENLKKVMLKTRPDAKELFDISLAEQLEWADTLIGTSDEGDLARRLIRIQGEWFERFGTVRGFIKPLMERSSVVAATCVGLTSIGEVGESNFDLCIIDEASKATAMESAVPMARSKRWVLVGDSKQLLPFQEEILVSNELRERYNIESEEATESMFGRFQRLLPNENKERLVHQYRMVALR